MNSKFKSGFVALAGRPNVGKSSLMNTVIGQKITIISEKPQTTRNQLKGILTGPDYQIVWIDTPGLHRPLHKLGTQMVATAQTAFFNVDLLLWVLDAGTGLTAADHKVAAELPQAGVPLFVIWNKMDLSEADKVKETKLPDLPGLEKVFEVSAVTGAGVPELLEAVIARLPSGPPFYPEDMVTDHPERFIAGEFIREQILRFTKDEVPHSIAVQVNEMKERAGDRVYVEAVIFVERDSQKAIVIGAGGERLKSIGQAARLDLEAMLDAPVFLNLWVKVRKNWRNNENALKEFGYWEKE